MMWQFKIFVFAFLFFAVDGFAQKQEPDSVFFVKYASPLDLLLQQEDKIADYKDYARDSVAFFAHAAGKMLTEQGSMTDFSGKYPDTVQGFTRYLFRKDGQLASSAAYASDSLLDSKYEYVYLHTGQVSRIVKTYGRSEKSDTISLVYDRAGKLFSYCEKGQCIVRLYNSSQQLIVKRNALYGYMRGDYTYAYDKEGRLIQRKFLEAKSGIVLCADTIQYSYSNEEKTLLTEKHYIRIAGKNEWIPIDEMLLNTDLHKVLRYDLFHYVSRAQRSINAPGYVEYTYNSEGKILLRRWDDKLGVREKEYVYSAASDTIRTYKVVVEKKAQQRILWSESIISYTPEGLLASETDIDYKIVKQRRKWKVSIAMIREEKYTWH